MPQSMTNPARPRIALIHAVSVAVQPVGRAFRERWPEAEVMNLLDDALSVDRARSSELTSKMRTRIATLGDYAVASGADAVLYTCSAFGEAIEAFAATTGLPVLKPNEAMFRRALAIGGRIGMLATFPQSVASMEAEFRQMAQQGARTATIETVLVADAMSALNAGDAATHNQLLAEAAAKLASCSAIMLAQFSTSVAREAVAAVVPCPVLTSPDAAVEELRARLASPKAAGPR